MNICIFIDEHILNFNKYILHFELLCVSITIIIDIIIYIITHIILYI